MVLVPTAPMPLHVFEPRYRRMVARCLEYDRRFGLVYHDADLQGPFLTEEGRVGCVAYIENFQPLPDGRSVLVVRGEARFFIQDGIESTEPYFEALVSGYEDRPEEPTALRRQRTRSLELFQTLVRSLPGEPGELPALDPLLELSFPLVRTLRVDAPWQQSFLELRSETQRLERLDAIFQAALDLG